MVAWWWLLVMLALGYLGAKLISKVVDRLVVEPVADRVTALTRRGLAHSWSSGRSVISRSWAWVRRVRLPQRAAHPRRQATSFARLKAHPGIAINLHPATAMTFVRPVRPVTSIAEASRRSLRETSHYGKRVSSIRRSA
jgi:hypothetical protein